MGKIIWKKHQSVFQDHIKYICNDIVKPFRSVILHNSERFQEMHDLSKYLSTPLMKGDIHNSDNWDVCNKGLYENEIRIPIKERLSSFIQDGLEDNEEEYIYLDHKDWCDLLSTIEVKDNRKINATQIKRLATSTETSNYDSHESIMVKRKKRVSTSVITSRKQQGEKTPKYHGIHRYCALFKKEVIHKQKYISHSFENCFVKCSDQQSPKEVLGGDLGNRYDAVKQ